MTSRLLPVSPSSVRNSEQQVCPAMSAWIAPYRSDQLRNFCTRFSVGRMMTTSPRKSFRAGRSLALLLPLAIASLHLSAQSQSGVVPSQTQSPTVSPPARQPPLRFEVASIRAHGPTGDEPSDRRILPGGRFIASVTHCANSSAYRIRYGRQPHVRRPQLDRQRDLRHQRHHH